MNTHQLYASKSEDSGYLSFIDGVDIPYESKLARDFLLYFTYLPSVEKIITKPVCISITENDATSIYSPDYLIHFNDGRRSLLVDVKPKSQWQAHWKEWKEKWKAAMAFAKENDCVFHIYDEDKIYHSAFLNIHFLQRYKQLQCDPEDIRAVLSQVELMGITNIDYLLARFFGGSLYRGQGLRIIYHLLVNKQLTCNWFEPMTEFTEVWGFYD